MLAEHQLLEPISEELQEHAGDALWQSLAALDAYGTGSSRRRHADERDSCSARC
jgi:hypothetical protein